MALRDNGFCSCADTIHFNNISSDGECSPVCAGEHELGPIRYCGSSLYSAVYGVFVYENITVPTTAPENVTVEPNVTHVNITSVPPSPVPILPIPPLQFTLAEKFQSASSSDTW